MTEIKFRAWDGKKMMSELPAYLEPHDVNETISSMNSEGIVLMQYTGLKDKNGKEIYEGDILLHKTDGIEYDGSTSEVLAYKAFVYYNKLSFNIKEIEGNRPVGIYPMTLIEFFNHSEIIGNIYENPELIK